MIKNLDFARMIESEQKELISKVQTEFWQGLFCDILKEHTFQSDFFLVRQDFDFQEIVEYLKNIVKSVCQKHELWFVVSDRSYRTEIKVRFHNNNILKIMYDELSIVICKVDITMRMLPHAPLLKMFSFEDYQLVGKILESLCDKLFGEKQEEFVACLETYKKIEKCSNELTAKTIEIAKNSIRTIYEASNEKFKTIMQKNLYSSMLAKGRMIRVLHSDFLADPNVLIKELR